MSSSARVTAQPYKIPELDTPASAARRWHNQRVDVPAILGRVESFENLSALGCAILVSSLYLIK
jgi:hypothetical protein